MRPFLLALFVVNIGLAILVGYFVVAAPFMLEGNSVRQGVALVPFTLLIAYPAFCLIAGSTAVALGWPAHSSALRVGVATIIALLPLALALLTLFVVRS
ncbi:MAG: hypothetical protein AAFQ42_07000 [Pseudomonadota bacterium]